MPWYFSFLWSQPCLTRAQEDTALGHYAVEHSPLSGQFKDFLDSPEIFQERLIQLLLLPLPAHERNTDETNQACTWISVLFNDNQQTSL